MKIPQDILDRIQVLYPQSEEQAEVLSLLQCIKQENINVGLDQLIRSLLIIAKSDQKKIKDIIDSNFWGDPRDIIMEGMAHAENSSNYGIDPFGPLLAFRVYPEPKGTNYFDHDLQTEDQVIMLFDYCQILEAIIKPEGWQFLIEKYGFKKLYELNNRSGWMDCDPLAEFRQEVEGQWRIEN